jgi:hypothetical protein
MSSRHFVCMRARECLRVRRLNHTGTDAVRKSSSQGEGRLPLELLRRRAEGRTTRLAARSTNRHCEEPTVQAILPGFDCLKDCSEACKHQLQHQAYPTPAVFLRLHPLDTWNWSGRIWTSIEQERHRRQNLRKSDTSEESWPEDHVCPQLKPGRLKVQATTHV